MMQTHHAMQCSIIASTPEPLTQCAVFVQSDIKNWRTTVASLMGNQRYVWEGLTVKSRW